MGHAMLNSTRALYCEYMYTMHDARHHNSWLVHPHACRCLHFRVMRRAHWDGEREVWVLERLSDVGKREAAAVVNRRPVSAAGVRRPTSSFAKIANAMGDMNPRFRGENILNLELDMPERTTYDYEGPGVDPRVQAAINAAFADDGELLFVGSNAAGQERVHGAEELAHGGGGGRARPGSARRGQR